MFTIRSFDSSSTFDSHFNELYETFFSKEKPSTTKLNTNIKTEDSAVKVEVEVPGVAPSDIAVKVEGRLLTVTTPRGNAYVPIGQRVKANDATATLKHGILTINVPTRGAEVTEIPVREA